MNIQLFLRLLRVIGGMLFSILQAEDSEGPGNGPAKRARVEKDVAAALRHFQAENSQQSCGTERLVQIVGNLIDNTVALLNCLGIFGTAK